MSYNQTSEISNKVDRVIGFERYAPIISLLLIPCSIVATMICAFGDNQTFKHLYLLPLATCLCIIVHLFNIKSQGNISFLLIGILYYIRNVVAPVVLVLDNYQSKFGSIDQSNIDNALIIMIWETILVTVFIKFLLQSKYKKKEKTYIYFGTIIYKTALVVGIIICIYALFGSPELRNSFYSIFTSNYYEISNRVVETGSSVLRNGGKVLIDALRLVVPITLIVILRRSKGQKSWIFVLSIIISLIQVLFMTDGNLLILLYVFVQLLLIYRIFPKYRSKLRTIMLALGLIGAFIMLTHRFLQSQSAYSKSISVFMQSYLGGICDVAGIFLYRRENVLSHMIIDYYSTVPFRSTLFGYSGNDILTVNFYNMANGAHSQILPTIAESYYFFGYLLSPLFSIILIYIAWLFEQKAKNENHFLYYSLFTLVYVIAAISIVMYDMRIFIADVLNIFIWMWLFIRLSRGVSIYIIDDLEEQD